MLLAYEFGEAGLEKLNGDDLDAGGRAPTVDALGDARSGCRGRIASGTVIESNAGAIAGNWFADLTFPFPVNLLPADVSWTLATGLEIIAPVALILGLATRFFSLALMLLTVVAIASVHSPAEWHSFAELWKGYAITDQGYGTPNCR